MASSADAGIRDEYRARLRKAISASSSFYSVTGELMAAYFLETQLGFALEYLPRTPTPTADFRVCKRGLGILAEVKTPVDRDPLTGAGWFGSRAPAVRSAWRKASRQLATKSGGNLLLVVDWHRPRIPREHAIDALYGDAQICQVVGPDGPIGNAHEVREKNRLCQFAKNTRLSAVGVLEWPGCAESTAYFVHNAYAANRIPSWAFDPWPQFVLDERKRAMVWRNLPDER
jgi:hypothetical protein